MILTLRQRQIVARVAAGLAGRTIPEYTIVNRVAFAVALARHTRRLIREELEREEGSNHRGSIGSVGDGGLDRDERHGKGQVALTRFIVGLLPEWVRFDLWRVLRERYGRGDPAGLS